MNKILFIKCITDHSDIKEQYDIDQVGSHDVHLIFLLFQLLIVAIVVLVSGANTEQYSDEELAALEQLKEAGFLESDIESLLEEYEAAYGDEDYEYELDEDYGDLDSASERGGPRRRKRPVGGRRAQRPTLFQMIQKRFFLGGGGRPQRRPPSGYGAPKRPSYKPHKPSYGPPKYKPKPTR